MENFQIPRKKIKIVWSRKLFQVNHLRDFEIIVDQ